MAASYPGSAKVFTARNNGDVIQATHVGDLQDEVSALESGLLNSLSHDLKFTDATYDIGKSGATRPRDGFFSRNVDVVGAFNVAGGSTCATLNVTAGSTFASRPVMPPPEAAIVFHDSTGGMGSSGGSTLAFRGQTFVSNASMHSTTTNPERLVPQSTGLYLFTAQASIAGAPSTSVIAQLFIQDSSNGVIAQSYALVSTAGSPPASIFASGYKRFDALGGHALVRFNNAGPGVSTLSLSSGAGATFFTMEKR